MKKWLAILLVVPLVFSVFACACKTESGEKTDRRNSENAVTDQTGYTDHQWSANEQYESVGYIAYGNFSEHKAFVLVADKGAYINDDFRLLFELPSETNFGYDFHEGYAVVTDKDYFSELYADYGDRPYVGKVYAMIDEKGDYVIEPGTYGWVSRVFNGKYLWWNKIESYTGTVYEMGMNDVKTQSTICRFDLPTKFVPSSPELVYITNNQILLTAYSNDYYTKSGSGVEIEYGNPNYSLQRETLYSFDYNGNRTLMPFPDYLYQPYFNKLTEFERMIGNGIMVCHDGNRRWFAIYDIFHNKVLNSSGTEYHVVDRSVVPGKYMIAQEGEKNYLDSDQFAIIDSHGKVVSTQTIDGVYNTITNVDDNLWVARFKNDFYGVLKVVETNGKPEIKFAFEPIQLKDDSIYAYELVYLGDRKFLNQMTNEILDEDGNIVGTIHEIDFAPDLSRQIKNGFFIIEDYDFGGMHGRYYVSSNGTVITTIKR